MDTSYSQAVDDQVRKSGREARKIGDDVKKHFDDVVSAGKDAVGEFGADARAAAERARDYMETARKKVGKATERVSTYADDNTALVAAAAFGAGLLVGYLVTRKA